MKKIKWTKEVCQKAALECKSRSEFKSKFSNIYKICRLNKWIDEVCSHMIKNRKPNNYWTYETCKKAALECKSRSEFSLIYKTAYKICCNNNWIDEMCLHMKIIKIGNNYWTYERCKEKALICNSRTEFYKKYNTAYKTSLKNNWIDEICSHMIKIGDYKKRCIYVAIFLDNYAYVGLTYKLQDRIYRHKNDSKSSIYNHIKETNLIPEFIQLTDYVNVETASNKLEEFYKTYYEGLGFNMLNIAKTGSIGGNIIKYTKEICQNEALKYNTRKEFNKKSNKIYNAARLNKWLNEICTHMGLKNSKPNLYWTKEKCFEAALLCNSRNELKIKYGTVYYYIHKNNWTDEMTKHMKKPKPYNYK
jgi:hypothetical protein